MKHDRKYFIVPHGFNLNIVVRLNGGFVCFRLTKLNRKQRTCPTPFSSPFLSVISRSHDHSLNAGYILYPINSLSIFNPKLHAVYVILIAS